MPLRLPSCYDHINYYNDAMEDLPAREQGYTGPGWYFWEETQSSCYGPYLSVLAAYDAFAEYGETL